MASYTRLCTIECFLCVHTEVNVLSGIAINWYIWIIYILNLNEIFVCCVHMFIAENDLKNSLVWRHCRYFYHVNNLLLCVIIGKTTFHPFCLYFDHWLSTSLYQKCYWDGSRKWCWKKIVDFCVGVAIEILLMSQKRFSEWRKSCWRGRKSTADNKLWSRSKFELPIRTKMQFRFTRKIVPTLSFNWTVYIKIELMKFYKQRTWTIQRFVLDIGTMNAIALHYTALKMN